MGQPGRGLALISLREVTKAFGGVVVLDGVSFDINPGDFIVLRGANGSGKTTLLNIASGLLEPDSGEILVRSGGECHETSFHFGTGQGKGSGFSLTRLARSGVMRSWQDVRLFSSLSLTDNLNVAVSPQLGERPVPALVRRPMVSRQEREISSASVEYLDSFGLSQLIRKETERSSGSRKATGATVSLGQAKRAALARACRGGARLLLLDEPLSGLDLDGVQSVVELLRTLNQERGVSVVVIEHESRVEHVAELATATWTLADGQLETRPRHAGHPAGFLETWIDRIASEDEARSVTDLPSGARLTTLDRTPADSEEAALRLDGVALQRGGRRFLPRLSLTLPSGSVAFLEAPNGWGKTTLAEVLAGVIPTAAGEVRVNGLLVNGDDPWVRRRAGLSLLHSRSEGFPKLSVEEALRVCGANGRRDIAHLSRRLMGTLSGGERQRVMLACAEGSGDHVLSVWDEPFLGLDHQGLEALAALIRERPRRRSFLVLLPTTAETTKEDTQ